MRRSTSTLLTEMQRATHRKSLRRRSAYLFIAPAMLFIVLTMVYPIFANLRMSVYDVNVGTFLSDTAPFVGLGNYIKVLRDSAFQKAFLLSLIFTVGSLVFQFTIGFALALLFNRSFPGNQVLRALMFVGLDASPPL